MTTRLRLKEDSPLYKDIEQVERLMDELGLCITGSHLRLVSSNITYYIGEESSCFPRQVEEPFWRQAN